jgi:hypothetical protein
MCELPTSKTICTSIRCWKLETLFFRAVIFKHFWFAARCKRYTNFLADFVHKIKNMLVYLKLWIKISIHMCFLSFFKYAFIIFAAHHASSSGASFENHCFRVTTVILVTADEMSSFSSSAVRGLFLYLVSLRYPVNRNDEGEGWNWGIWWQKRLEIKVVVSNAQAVGEIPFTLIRNKMITSMFTEEA